MEGRGGFGRLLEAFGRNARAETAEIGKTRIPLSVLGGIPERRQRKLEKQEFRCLFWAEYPGGDSGNWKNKNSAVCFTRNARAETAEIGKTRIPLSVLGGIPGRRQRKLEKQEFRCLFLSEHPGGDSGNWKNKNPAVCFGRNTRAETAEMRKIRIPLSVLVGIPERRQRKLEKQESRCFLTEFLKKSFSPAFRPWGACGVGAQTGRHRLPREAARRRRRRRRNTGYCRCRRF